MQTIHALPREYSCRHLEDGFRDVYRGRILIKAGGWREAFIAPGFVTIALHLIPNGHELLIPESAIASGCISTRDFNGHCPMDSPFIHIGSLIDDDAKAAAQFVRFGRVATVRQMNVIDGPGTFIQDPVISRLQLDLDNLEAAA